MNWWNNKLRSWVLPAANAKDGTIVPVYEENDDEQRRGDLKKLWDALSNLEQHEDTLFNNRIQSFLVVTSFLLAGLSQFRDRPYFVVQVVFCLSGIGFSGGALYILKRTARSIEWYLESLIRLDKVLYSEDLQPYRTRRVKTGKRTTGDMEATVGSPVSAMLGVALPYAALLLWGILLALSWIAHYHASTATDRPTGTNSPDIYNVQRIQTSVIQENEDQPCPEIAPKRRTEKRSHTGGHRSSPAVPCVCDHAQQVRP